MLLNLFAKYQGEIWHQCISNMAIPKSFYYSMRSNNFRFCAKEFLKTFEKEVDHLSLIVKDLRKIFHQFLSCFTKFAIRVLNWLIIVSKSFFFDFDQTFVYFVKVFTGRVINNIILTLWQRRSLSYRNQSIDVPEQIIRLVSTL